MRFLVMLIFGGAWFTSMPPTAWAQTCSVGTNSRDFFTFCSPGSSLVFDGDYSITVGQGGSITLNGNITITGTLTITFTGNTGSFVLPPDIRVEAGNVEVVNSNPRKIIDIDGEFHVNGTLDFNGEQIDLDGTGSIFVASIAASQNVTCSDEGDCPSINATVGCSPPTFGLCAETGVLPIELIAFTGFQEADKIVLEWRTLSETNFDHFLIEKSPDGLNFTLLEARPGEGNNNNGAHYSLVDPFPLIAKNYYRLISIDKDGQKEIFDVIGVNFEGTKELFVYPNPVEGSEVCLRFNFKPKRNMAAVFFDGFSGESSPMQLPENNSCIDISQLHPGVWVLNVQGAEFSKSIPLLIKR